MLIAAPMLLANAPQLEPEQDLLRFDMPLDSPRRLDLPPAIPPAIKAMLEEAMRSENNGELSTIVKYARIVDPPSADLVLSIAEKWRADREAQRQQNIREAAIFDLWDGRAELGGYFTTGNSETAGASAVIDAKREGLQWRHKFLARADYQENRNETVREHYLAAYEPNYKIDDRLYIYGAAQYEADKFLGYYHRFSVSAGAGYTAINSRALRLDVELGPAFRQTSNTDGTFQSSPAARGTVNLRWQMLPGLSLTQAGAAYVQRFNSSLSSTTAVSAKLIGPLSASMSYYVQYESMPSKGSVPTDTTGRASLVYNF